MNKAARQRNRSNRRRALKRRNSLAQVRARKRRMIRKRPRAGR